MAVLMIKRLKKLRRFKKVKDLVPSSVAEKAATYNPMAAPTPEQAMSLENVPQITNETIAEHREDVLSGARKYIYPLAHSKHRIITVTVAIVVLAVIAFLAYSIAGLYKYYQN